MVHPKLNSVSPLAFALAIACAWLPCRAQGQTLPSCVVLPPAVDSQTSPGLSSVIVTHLTDILESEGQVVVVPRDVAHGRLRQYGFNRTEYETETEAATIAGLVNRADYVLIGNIDRSPQGYALSLSLVDVRAGNSLKRGTTQAIQDPQDFVRRSPRSVMKFLVPPGETVFVKSAEPLPLPPPSLAGPAILAPVPAAAEPDVAEPSYPTPVAVAEEPVVFTDTYGIDSESPWAFADGHLELGTRMTAFYLLKSSDESFVGSVTELKEEQDFLPIKFFARWKFNEDVAVEVTWDRVEAEARPPDDPDGVFSAMGPMVSGVLMFPTDTYWTPYGFAGFGWMFCEFQPYTWWERGFEDPAQMETYGADYDTNNTRFMDVDDAIAVLIGGGASYAFNDSLALDLYLRYTSLELKNHYYQIMGDRYVDHGNTRIPFDNLALGIGIKYVY